jgi:hypothetical protein
MTTDRFTDPDAPRKRAELYDRGFTPAQADRALAPDWPPRDTASQYPEGYAKRGSTGQLFEVKYGRWVRVPEESPRG